MFAGCLTSRRQQTKRQPEFRLLLSAHVSSSAGAYAAFSAGGRGGGGLHFVFELVSLYNTGGAPFSTEKRNIFLCL